MHYWLILNRPLFLNTSYRTYRGRGEIFLDKSNFDQKSLYLNSHFWIPAATLNLLLLLPIQWVWHGNKNYWASAGEMELVTMSLVLTGKLTRPPVRCWLMREGGGDEGGGDTDASLSSSAQGWNRCAAAAAAAAAIVVGGGGGDWSIAAIAAGEWKGWSWSSEPPSSIRWSSLTQSCRTANRTHINFKTIHIDQVVFSTYWDVTNIHDHWVDFCRVKAVDAIFLSYICFGVFVKNRL